MYSDKKNRVLLVDDEKGFLDAISTALSKRGFQITAATKPTIVQKIIAVVDFDVAVIDIKMPELDGNQLLEKMLDSNPEIPVIILTGHGTSQQRLQYLKNGAYAYLQKPCSVNKLARICNEAIQYSKRGALDFKRIGKGL